jgi:hypothetical protein
MNSGAWVPPFIEQLTGISNAMLPTRRRPCGDARGDALHRKGCPLVAHNAAFDRGFWRAEGRTGRLRRPTRHTLRLHAAAVAPPVPAGPQPPPGHAGHAALRCPTTAAPTARWPTPLTTAQLLLRPWAC